MTPQSLTVSGFLPFSEKVTIDFTENPYAVISGVNGVGKSSLLIDGIIYSLYGESRQKPQWLINNHCDQSDVTFRFLHRGDACSIRRFTERGKTSKISFTVAETDLSERTITATQSKIEEFLGFSKKLLLATCIAGQEQANIFSDMGPTEREKTLTSMLGLEIWEAKKKKAGEWLSAIKNERSRVDEIRHDLITLVDDIVDLDTQRDEVEPIHKTLQTQFEEVKQREMSFIHEAAKYDEAERVRDEISRIEKEISEGAVWLRSSWANEPREVIKDKITKVNTELITEQKKLDKTELQAAAFMKALNEDKEMLSYLKGYQVHDVNADILDQVPCVGMEDLHSTCDLLIHARQSAEALSELLRNHGAESLKEVVDRTTVHAETMNKNHQELTTFFHRLRLSIHKKKQEIQKLEGLHRISLERESIQKKQDDCEQKLIILKERLSHLPQGQLQGMHVITAQKNRIQGELSIAWENLTKVMGEIKWRREKIDTLQKILKELEESIAEWSFYEDLQTAYKEIPSSLLYDTVPLIERYANEVLSRISSNHMVQIRIHRETQTGNHARSIDLVSISPNGSLPFASLSGSERFRESLAIRIGLSRVIAEQHDSPLDFFIIDESFGCLDTTNTEIVKETLRAIAKVFKMLYVITHVEELKDCFSSEIIVAKDSPQVSIKYHGESNEVVLDNN